MIKGTSRVRKVFIGSTFKDLKECRAAVRDAVLAMGCYPEMMEYWSAMPEDSLKACLGKMRACDIYIGLFGSVYGSIPPNYQQSYTELEYDEAKRLGIPCLCFLLDLGDTPPSVSPEEAQRLQSFRAKVEHEHVRKMFVNCGGDFRADVLHALHTVLVGQLRQTIKTVSISTTDVGWQLINTNLVLRQLGDDDRLLVEKPPETTAYGPALLRQLAEDYAHIQRLLKRITLNASDDCKVDVRCINHDLIRNNIRSSVREMRLIELSGPSGSGKTHILKSVLASGDDPEDKWRFVYVDVKETELTFHSVMEAILYQLKDSATGTVISAQPAELLAGRIVRLAASTHNIVFLIDNVDRLPAPDLAHLIGAEGPVGAIVENKLDLKFGKGVKPLLRMVITASRPQVTQQFRMKYAADGLVKVQHSYIDALSEEGVKEMLCEWLEVVDLQRPQDLDELNHQIFEISGGHPGAVASLLCELTPYAFTPPEEMFNETLFPRIIGMLSAIIGDNLPLNEYLFLNVMSVCRRFIPSLVTHYIRRGLLPENLIGESSESGNRVYVLDPWLRDFMLRTELIRRVGQRLEVQSVLRRVLPKLLETRSPLYLHRLHTEAFEYYDAELNRRETSAPLYGLDLGSRPQFILEAIYHYVSGAIYESADAPVDDPAFRRILDARLEEKLTGYCKTFTRQFEDYVTNEKPGRSSDDDLVEAWGADQELQRLIERKFGKKTLQRLNDIIVQEGIYSPS